MGLSLRRQQMGNRKTETHSKRDDEVADFEYRRDLLSDIEEILTQAEPFISIDVGAEEALVIDRALLRRVAEDIVRYITT